MAALLNLMNFPLIKSALFLTFLVCVCSFPDKGKWKYKISKTDEPELIVGISKPLYNQSTITMKVTCDEDDDLSKKIIISWLVRQTPCYEEYIDIASVSKDKLMNYYEHPLSRTPYSYKTVHYLKSQKYTIDKCHHGLHITEPITDKFVDGVVQHLGDTHDVVKATNVTMKTVEKSKRNKRAVIEKKTTKVFSSMTIDSFKKVTVPNSNVKREETPNPQIIIDRDGVYLLVLKVRSADESKKLSATVSISIESTTGYLSAVDWPLLPFYGTMCVIYLFYGIAWLIVSACQWRDLIRIQFWIGGVIVLGMFEKAIFYAEYQSINSTGLSVVEGAVIFAELVSCLKRTLARMLVIIVSLGFGIVKPRLGSMLHRVIGVGALYFVLGSVEGCLRVLKPKNDPSSQYLMASIPLAVLDSAICWWVFSSLLQTTRTLRLRRNIVKLSLYRHFTNTLIFAVLASVAFMIWSIRSHRLTDCLTDWKELWIDEAYWHLLFSVVLLVIMFLWRPNNNNQRYAFTPLLDVMDEEDEQDDQNHINDAYVGMTMRGKTPVNVAPKTRDNKIDEDLKWVEENIPSSIADKALPSLVDSDEEIMTTKFELSKME